MKVAELDIIEIFSKDISGRLTINQISNILGKSYAFTNKYVRDMIAEGILHKKIVGSAILCYPDYSNERTLGLLIMDSIETKQKAMAKDQKLKHLQGVLEELPHLQCIFTLKNQIHIITHDKTTKLPSQNCVLLDHNEFKLKVPKLDMNDVVIMKGYEIFWRLVASMV